MAALTVSVGKRKPLFHVHIQATPYGIQLVSSDLTFGSLSELVLFYHTPHPDIPCPLRLE